MAQLYAIAGSLERARFYLAAGVPWLQLRIKEGFLPGQLDEVASWPARYPATRLVMNDDPWLARQTGCWGVHLGQEDLDLHFPGWPPAGLPAAGALPATPAPLPAPAPLPLPPPPLTRPGFPPLYLGAAHPQGLGLGISTHSSGEVARALAFSPHYIGFGPIFSTGSKQLAHPPQGLRALARVAAGSPVAVAAIGGIGWAQAPQVAAAGAALVAMIAALETLDSPERLAEKMARLSLR